MLRQNYDFSSVHINITEPLASEIFGWGKDRIKDENLYRYSGTLGREDEIHITVLYGIHSEHSQQTRELMRKDRKFTVKLGECDIFTANSRFDVIYLKVECERLYEINKKLKQHVTYSTRYIKYEPHITIAYVKKDQGWDHITDATFKNREFECEFLTFSSKTGTKERIELG